MKYFIYFLMISALGLFVYNLTMIDFSNVMGEDSKVAVACTLASLCVIVLMLILLISREIKKRAEA
jgi:Na+/melibiose symporter-like transporter